VGPIAGRTRAFFTGWQETDAEHELKTPFAVKLPPIKAHVPTEPCGYKNPPIYFTSLVQPGAERYNGWRRTGGNVVYRPSAHGFSVYLDAQPPIGKDHAGRSDAAQEKFLETVGEGQDKKLYSAEYADASAWTVEWIGVDVSADWYTKANERYATRDLSVAPTIGKLKGIDAFDRNTRVYVGASSMNDIKWRPASAHGGMARTTLTDHDKAWAKAKSLNAMVAAPGAWMWVPIPWYKKADEAKQFKIALEEGFGLEADLKERARTFAAAEAAAISNAGGAGELSNKVAAHASADSMLRSADQSETLTLTPAVVSRVSTQGGHWGVQGAGSLYASRADGYKIYLNNAKYANYANMYKWRPATIVLWGIFSQDCVASPFTEWGPCSDSCGEGWKVRERQVRRPASSGGKPCPKLKDEMKCNMAPCPRDCVLSTWTAWSPSIAEIRVNSSGLCGASDGAGDGTATGANSSVSGGATNGAGSGVYQSRSRAVLKMAENGGKACPNAMGLRQKQLTPTKACVGGQGAGSICGGATPKRVRHGAGKKHTAGTPWAAYGTYSIYTWVQTASCKYESTPQYVASLVGVNKYVYFRGRIGGAVSISRPSKYSFQVVLSGGDMSPPINAKQMLKAAKMYGWRVSWAADMSARAGRTVSGLSSWQPQPVKGFTKEMFAKDFGGAVEATTGWADQAKSKAAQVKDASAAKAAGKAAETPSTLLRLFVNTTLCKYAQGVAANSRAASDHTSENGGEGGLDYGSGDDAGEDNTNAKCNGKTGKGCSAPQYFVSLVGSKNTHRVVGGQAVFHPSVDGFVVYVNYPVAVTAAQVNRWGWTIGWIGLLPPVHYSDSFSGLVSPAWKSNEALSGGEVFHSNIDTSRHSFERPPQYVFTLVLPLNKNTQPTLHEYQASTMIGSASADAFEKGSFRVYVGGMAGLSAKEVGSLGWSVQYMGFGRVDCKISPWSRWTACTRECGGGVQHKVRSVQLRPQGGGKPCKPGILFFKEQACNVVNCVGQGPSSFCGEAAPRGALKWQAFGHAAIFTIVDVGASVCDFSGAAVRQQQRAVPSRRLQQMRAKAKARSLANRRRLADKEGKTHIWHDVHGIATSHWKMSREYLATPNEETAASRNAAMDCRKKYCTVCHMAAKFCCLDVIQATGKCGTCAQNMGCVTQTPTAMPTMIPTTPTDAPTAAPSVTEKYFKTQLWLDIQSKMTTHQKQVLASMKRADLSQIQERLFVKKHEHDLYLTASKRGVLPPGVNFPPTLRPTPVPTSVPTLTPTLAPSPVPCMNGVKDGTETDVDCGGDACTPCAPGLHCQRVTDCATGVCTLHAASITAGVKICGDANRRRLVGNFEQVIAEEIAQAKVAQEWEDWEQWHEETGEEEDKVEVEVEDGIEGMEEADEAGYQRRRLSLSDGEEGDDGAGGAGGTDTNGAATPSVFYAASVIGADSHWQLTGEATISRMNASHFTAVVMHPVIHGKALLMAARRFKWSLSWVGEKGKNAGITVQGKSGWKCLSFPCAKSVQLKVDTTRSKLRLKKEGGDINDAQEVLQEMVRSKPVLDSSRRCTAWLGD
jgi:hypothetical protein